MRWPMAAISSRRRCKRRAPEGAETRRARTARRRTRALPPDATAEDIQNIVYEIGKTGGFDDLRDWFRALYETLAGVEPGAADGQLHRALRHRQQPPPHRRGAGALAAAGADAPIARWHVGNRAVSGRAGDGAGSAARPVGHRPPSSPRCHPVASPRSRGGQRLDHRRGLRDRPAHVDRQPQPLRRPDRLAQRRAAHRIGASSSKLTVGSAAAGGTSWIVQPGADLRDPQFEHVIGRELRARQRRRGDAARSCCRDRP